MLFYCVEAWTFPSGEENCEEELVDHEELLSAEDAQRWCWDRLLEGFQVRLYLR